MRLVLVLALVGCGSHSVASAPEPPDEPGYVHGMLVFGERTTYLSHLPLFHAPHDHQIILAVTLSADDATPAAVLAADREATGERLYTFAPAPFALHHATEPGFTMHGALVHGHFERGGSPIVADTRATVARVIYAHHLEPGAAAEPLTYLLFGDPDDAYLVHHLTAAPDFDQVLSVAALPPSIDAGALAAGVLVRCPDIAPGTPLAAGERIDARVDGADGAQPIEVGAQIYLERGELAD